MYIKSNCPPCSGCPKPTKLGHKEAKVNSLNKVDMLNKESATNFDHKKYVVRQKVAQEDSLNKVVQMSLMNKESATNFSYKKYVLRQKVAVVDSLKKVAKADMMNKEFASYFDYKKYVNTGPKFGMVRKP